MGNNSITTEELLKDLTDGYSAILEPGEITVSMVKKTSGLSTNGARELIERKIKSGELVQVDSKFINSHWVNVYRKA